VTLYLHHVKKRWSLDFLIFSSAPFSRHRCRKYLLCFFKLKQILSMVRCTIELSYCYSLTHNPFNWTAVLVPVYMHRSRIELLAKVMLWTGRKTFKTFCGFQLSLWEISTCVSVAEFREQTLFLKYLNGHFAS